MRGADQLAQSSESITLYLTPGRQRHGYYLICACIALYGGWYWFGTSGLALAALWLRARFSAAVAQPTSPVRIEISAIAARRVEPWRVSLWHRSGEASTLMRERARTRVRWLARTDVFRDELDPDQWARLRRNLLNRSARSAISSP